MIGIVRRKFVAQVGEGNVHARSREALDDGPADAAAPPGDESIPTGKSVFDLESRGTHPEIA